MFERMAPNWSDGLTYAGPVTAIILDVPAKDLPAGRSRHGFGTGPFARLRMPPLPDTPGIYLWVSANGPLYVGQTTGTLRGRLGPNGYATISNYNTLAREPQRTNGGQQTNCRVNSLANSVLKAGAPLDIWYRSTSREEARLEESRFMRLNGLPPWNLQDRR